ncbi:MAG: hypothetical protein MSC52_00725 [Solobacterium sp.]|nr:hypothetical protein [Solobacterium sp.]MDY2952685.1 hypothetical protein [Erysipelotrichaceae bacterium]MCI6877471.1 hypothetical protein [Solobacterium sp.]MCI7156092.1 hypothetical protein [Solobacterium sp.]MDD7775716.1 hypothetical protein [Solobacterium sp.]
MDNKENINDQVATVIDIDEKPKKNHLLLKILLIVLFLVIASSLSLVLLANNTSTLQEHFDDIEAYKAQIVNKDDDRNVNLANNIIDSITYDEKTKEATLALSKAIVYNYIDLDILNTNLSKYNITFQQMGYDVDTKNNEINLYMAITYKKLIKAGVKATLSYEFTDTDFILKFNDATVGNLPRFIYEKSLPAKHEELYRQNISELIVGDDIKVKVINPSQIINIRYDKNGTTYITLDISTAIDDLIDELFNSNEGISKFEEIIDYYFGKLSLNDIKDWLNGLIK